MLDRYKLMGTVRESGDLRKLPDLIIPGELKQRKVTAPIKTKC